LARRTKPCADVATRRGLTYCTSADRTYYEILGVPASSSQSEIRSAYRRLSRKVHPDAGHTAAVFQVITDAYRTLSDPLTRQHYDQSLRSGGRNDQPPPNLSKAKRPSPGPDGTTSQSTSHAKRDQPSLLTTAFAKRPAEFLLVAGIILLIVTPT